MFEKAQDGTSLYGWQQLLFVCIAIAVPMSLVVFVVFVLPYLPKCGC
jgi:hypothetical protein